MVNRKKVNSIKEEIDTFNDLDKLKNYAKGKADEFKQVALKAIESKAMMITASLPQGIGTAIIATLLQAKVIAADISDVTEKIEILAKLAQKMQELGGKLEQTASGGAGSVTGGATGA